MSWSLGLPLTLATILAMEGVAWATHKYVMHGFLWVLHESHHRPRRGLFELNDLFGLFFAAIATGLCMHGLTYDQPTFFIGLGMAGYGLIYFLVHDVLVHRRLNHPLHPTRGYLGRLVAAHHLHHAVKGKHGAVSFGFVFPGDPDVLAQQMRAQALSRRKTGV